MRETAILAAAAFLNPDHGSGFDRSFCRAVRSSNARPPLPAALEKLLHKNTRSSRSGRSWRATLIGPPSLPARHGLSRSRARRRY
jgi:hypothetical protein